MSKHTPGPWTNLPRHECIPLCRMDDAGLSIGFVHSSDPKRQAEGLANSYLIVAAPDMFEALNDCRRVLELANFTQELAVVDAAIAKARGEA